MTRPAGERELVLYELLEARGQGVPTDEAHVTRALDPLHVRKDAFTDAQTVETALTALLRSAGAFVLDAYNVWEVINSGAPPEMDVLPPLPFKRVWIEAQLDGQPTSYAGLTGSRFGGPIFIRGVGIIEHEPRKEWTVILPCALPSIVGKDDSYWDAMKLRTPGAGTDLDQETFSLTGELVTGTVPRGLVIPMGFRMTPAGIVSKLPGERGMDEAHGDEWKAIINQAMRQIIVNAAHLITARNVPHHEVVIPRAQRKRAARAGNFVYQSRLATAPKIYYVDLNASGEIKPGTGDREYRHRWLVAGHWMHMPPGKIGKDLCTCWRHRDKPLSASFREAYVKGPPGAPWMGKPIHTDTIEHKEAAA
jgi:hypothetical protein